MKLQGFADTTGSSPRRAVLGLGWLWQLRFGPPSEREGMMTRVAEVEGARERRSPKGQGLLRKEGPPTYAILSRNLVLSRFTRFLKGFHRAFN